MSLTQINKAGLDELALDHVFTIGASGSSAYTFQGEGLNGTVNNPTLYLTRGKTYRFENGSGGHPIRIQSTSGASGTAYNTGVTNNAGSGTVIVEVQHDAPDVLYYQCTSHAAMNGILYITGALADGGVTTAKIANDAVTTAKIVDDAVTAAKIADGTIQQFNLASNAVTTAKINANAVTTAKMADGSINTTQIADQAVTLAKLEHGTSSNNGKFLRANNGADPTFETVNTDLVSDTSPQLGGDLASNSNDIVMADNDQIKLGASNDFTMFHDSSGHTFLQDQGNGALRIRSDSEVAIQKWNGSTNENMAKFVPDGAVELYHDNGIRLTTTSTGINVTQLGNSFSNFHHGGGASGVRIAGPAAASGANLVFANNFDNSVSDEWAISLDGATDDLVFKSEGAGGTDRIRFLDNGGICFGTDTATANALDDYEEGTWTPNVAANNSGSYTARIGNYTKIGNIVHVDFYVDVSSVGYGVSYFRLGGLPFTSNSNSYSVGSFMAKYHGMNNNRWYSLYLSANNTIITAYGSENTANWELMNADSTFEMIGQITYRV